MITTRQVVLDAFYKITGQKDISCDTNFFSAPNSFTPRDVAYVLLLLRKSLNIDLNYVYHNLKDTTINELISLVDKSNLT